MRRMAPGRQTSASQGVSVSDEKFNKGIDSIKSMISDLKCDLSNRIDSVTTYVDTQVKQVIARVDAQDIKIASIAAQPALPPLEDIDRCVIITGLPMEKDEDSHSLQAKIEQLLAVMDVSEAVFVSQYTRLGLARSASRPVGNFCPLTKVALATVSQQQIMLRKKGCLKYAGAAYQRVYIRPSYSQEQRRMQAGMRDLAIELGMRMGRGGRFYRETQQPHRHSRDGPRDQGRMTSHQEYSREGHQANK